MASTVSERLDAVPLRNLKVDDSARRNLTPRGALIEQAMKNAGLEPKQIAADMGVSVSFLLRGFKDHEHISWQRIKCVKSPQFHRERIALEAAETEGVEVITEIRVRRSA